MKPDSDIPVDFDDEWEFIPPPPRMPSDVGCEIVQLDKWRHPNDWIVEAEMARLERDAKRMSHIHTAVAVTGGLAIATAFLLMALAALSSWL